MQENKVRSHTCRCQTSQGIKPMVVWRLNWALIHRLLSSAAPSPPSAQDSQPWRSEADDGLKISFSIHVEQDLITPLCRSLSFKKERSILLPCEDPANSLGHAQSHADTRHSASTDSKELMHLLNTYKIHATTTKQIGFLLGFIDWTDWRSTVSIILSATVDKAVNIERSYANTRG